ncbi:hypothetical protein U8326_05820 [Tsuneonella sp. CC-YZS046]|uniref:hypothetical protein n=1 Tax=Tsuneonella sp. CC-YZS046 TaxID=3042152 RepID=UPI002D78227D|nr:hypothetical protein [Tsuneonella sp. CC-YZS046]WRO67670.1 hypothetical protein U8326_05820 [Tsuneonella sp. CC-YZS046]
MKRVALSLLLLTGACGGERPNAQEKEAQDLRDIAMVEAAQKIDPPREPVTPEEITDPDFEDRDLMGVSCNFIPTGQRNPVAVGLPGAAFVKLNAKMERLAADKGGDQMPFGTWAKYDGKKYVLKFAKDDSDGKPLGSEATQWSGRMTLLDPYDRSIYESFGTFQCGS